MKLTNRLLLTCLVTLAAANICLAETAFTKIPIDAGYNYAAAGWVDFDNDGHLDLVVVNGVATTSGDHNVIFRNNRAGAFTKITSGVVATDLGYSLGIAYGDYDNDGLPDLFFGGVFAPTPTQSLLYHNLGNGDYERIAGVGPVTTQGNFLGTWVDYDDDGFLDIFLSNTGGPNYLFRNQGDGSFASGPLIATHGSGGNLANGATWADYDNDGYPDVFLAGGSGLNLLFHNERNGTFTRVPGAPFDTDSGPSVAPAWGDYDNDGYLDLIVPNGNFDTISRRNYLYHNNTNGTFTKITTGAIVTDLSASVAAAWEDYDNDGYLDLFVSQNTRTGAARKNLLYHNNGNGTFTSVINGSLTSDSGYFAGVAWGDFDEDGFPDLFVVARQPSFLYHNEGNSNNWVTFKLVGTVSNRLAIGAKVRVRATIGGKTYWQMRYLSNGDNMDCNSLSAHFGLGDATNVEALRIEWPSGTVQEFQNVAAKQFLTVTEPSRLQIGMTNEIAQLTLRGGRGFQYDLQTSTNLTDWSLLTTLTITNLSGTALLTNSNARSSERRFYRATLLK